ncbi:flagellar biosynthetic protein FliO [Erythrobacter sp. sf7]|uniref:Flagellar biosynthetic protein FliO n=1 Tax=Erythrobacter fulvus TaxID=2987523 RepID=A0ABT5JVP5_9SPHN|nr:flagellar biosynthetic protein FliO [Erythrobacter fulvus]MDC8755607.1 flagellar biosynthetic protein FliO [Erythrobacter fulvus]
MLEYLLRLALLLPLLAGLIWGSLWLTRFMQARLSGQPGSGGRQLQLIETSLIAPGMKLAVVRFRDRDILLGCTRQGMVRLGEASAPSGDLLPETE